MSDSPYQPPQAAGYAGPDDTRTKLRSVARYQRWVIFALLANITVNIVAIAAQGQGVAVGLALLALALAVAAFAIVSIFMLGKELMHPALAALCGLLMLVPCNSLIVLLVVNQQATSYLQQHGVRVGFFGVDPNAI